MVHISYSVAKNCQNLYDSYGMICVHCNCCGRIDPETMLQCQLETTKRWLKEKQEFDGWSDDPEVSAIQRKNVATDVGFFKRNIKAIKAKIARKERADVETARKGDTQCH